MTCSSSDALLVCEGFTQYPEDDLQTLGVEAEKKLPNSTSIDRARLIA